jgi:hypothetical protein
MVLVVVLSSVSFLIACFIFVKMAQTGHMNNFIITHAVWVISVQQLYTVNFLIYSGTQICFFWYVSSRQLAVYLWASIGIISMLARLIDKSFMKAARNMLCRTGRPKRRTVLLSGNTHLLSRGISSATFISNQLNVFESLHLKVSSRQFILDSLISLSFYLARESIYSSDGVET